MKTKKIEAKQKQKRKWKQKQKWKQKRKWKRHGKQNENKNSIAIDGQLSLDWPRSAITFLLNPRGLEVPYTVNSLLLGLEVP